MGDGFFVYYIHEHEQPGQAIVVEITAELPNVGCESYEAFQVVFDVNTTSSSKFIKKAGNL